MFEVNIFTPGTDVFLEKILIDTDWCIEQFGAFIPWLVINRGPLSALIHPNTDDEERDHTQRATWMGQPLPLNLRMFKKLSSKV
jgi:aromatic ring-cleaving dioxygenase